MSLFCEQHQQEIWLFWMELEFFKTSWVSKSFKIFTTICSCETDLFISCENKMIDGVLILENIGDSIEVAVHTFGEFQHFVLEIRPFESIVITAVNCPFDSESDQILDILTVVDLVKG